MVSKLWQQTLGVCALLGIAIPMFPSHAQTPIKPDQPMLIAQLGAVSYCRRVDANNGLIVRAEPGRNSRVIDTLPNNTIVTIDDSVSLAKPSPSNWVLISEPTEGYVHSNYLTLDLPFLCQENPNQCARVISQNGLNVRERPTTQSRIVTTLSHQETVNVTETIDASRWVKINEPVNGFVYSKHLGGNGPHGIPVCGE